MSWGETMLDSQPGTESGTRNRTGHREKDREMLARVKEFVGDDDKLLEEYQQDTGADIDIDVESGQPGDFNLEHKDFVEEPRRVSRRLLRRVSLRMWLRVQVCLRESLRGSLRVWLRVWIRVCLHAERECCVMALGDQSRAGKRDCERMLVQIAHSSVAQNQVIASAGSASSTTPLTRTTQLRCGKPRTVVTVAAKVKQVELW